MAAPVRTRSPQAALEKALKRFSQGRLDEAGTLCRKYLKRNPGDANALHLLGVVQLQGGSGEAAIATLGRAAGADAGNPEIHNNLAAALRRSGRPEDAIASGLRAVALNPSFARAHYNLGLAHQDGGAAADAARCFETALAADPGLVDARRRLAAMLCIDEHPEAALAQIEIALGAEPGDSGAHSTRGVALVELGRADEAIAEFRRAVALDADFAEAHVNLGNTLADSRAEDEAIVHFERALAIEPGCADTLANLGHALRQTGRLDQAVTSYDDALAVDAASIEAHFGNAVAHLTRGMWSTGWRHYLGRDSMKAAAPELTRATLPDDLSGRRALVLPDQGIGDELFFLRFAAALRARGAWIAYRAEPRLAAMLRRARVADAIVGADDAPADADLTLSVGDLPWLLGMADGETPPQAFPIPPLDDRMAAMRARLDALGPPPYIGVTWRAGTKGRKRLLDKEAPLESIAAALGPVAATFVALQRGPAESEIAEFAGHMGRALHDFTALNDDLEDMLALVALLDDYVCVSNTNVHLRAATGRPCRILVPSPPEFRWMAEGAESPWFEGSPVYRQDISGSWDAALAALARDMTAG